MGRHCAAKDRGTGLQHPTPVTLGPGATRDRGIEGRRVHPSLWDLTAFLIGVAVSPLEGVLGARENEDLGSRGSAWTMGLGGKLACGSSAARGPLSWHRVAA